MGAVSQALKLPRDPSSLSYPPTLPVEIALRVGTVKEICEGYGLAKPDWDRLKADPVFVDHLARVVDSLKKEGMSFKLKAQLQAEELLKKSWSMIFAPMDEVPANVKADLLKSTVRWAGLEPEKGASTQVTVPLQINLNL
jgi:hypothetical protein